MEESVNVRYVFMMMLAIADPDGIVVGTDVAIARRLNIPLQEFRNCVEILGRPDPDSNSQKAEGRRVVPSEAERGYQLVNYATYRGIRDEEDRREYMREYMRKRRAGENAEDVAPVNSRKQRKQKLANAEAEKEVETDGKADSAPSLNEFLDFYRAKIADLGAPLSVEDYLLETHGYYSADVWPKGRMLAWRGLEGKIIAGYRSRHNELSGRGKPKPPPDRKPNFETPLDRKIRQLEQEGKL